MYTARIGRIAFAFAVMFGTASCAAILGFEHLNDDGIAPGNETGAPDAQNTADVTDGGGLFDGPPDACGLIGIPDPPVDAAAGVVPDLLGAIRLFDFGVDVDGGRPQIPGFNLDQTCSVNVATSSCRTSLLEATFDSNAKDKNTVGLDNAGFTLIDYIGQHSSVISAQSINDAVAAGLYGGVIRLSQWNGLPDDDDVTIELFPAIGVQNNADGGIVPEFNDGDTWLLDDRFQVGGVLIASTLKSERAWIVGNQVVGRFKELTIPVAIADDPKHLDVHILDAILSATVGMDAHNKTALVGGVVAGRWKTSEFLGQVRTIFVKDASGLTNTTLCDKVAGATLIYDGVKSVICDGRDIRSDSQDNKNLPCDAISSAIRIESYNVKSLGTFTTPFDAGVRCADPAIPLGDDCPPQ